MCIQRPKSRDLFGCNECEWIGHAETLKCGECGSSSVYLYMRAPSRAELSVMRALSSKDLEAGLTDIDPDWRERFQDVDAAVQFYGVQAEERTGKEGA